MDFGKVDLSLKATENTSVIQPLGGLSKISKKDSFWNPKSVKLLIASLLSYRC
jgi:hypothetical protein